MQLVLVQYINMCIYPTVGQEVGVTLLEIYLYNYEVRQIFAANFDSSHSHATKFSKHC